MQVYVVHRYDKVYGVYVNEGAALDKKEVVMESLKHEGLNDYRVYVDKRTLEE